MQNDVLYNTIMKKIFIIEIKIETPEGEETPASSITKYNMTPDEVLAYGNMPLIGFCILHDLDNSYTLYESIVNFSVTDDNSALTMFIIDGREIDADLTNNLWKIHEE